MVAAKLANTESLPVGSWLATPVLGSTDPLVMGIVSVSARAIPRAEAILGIQLAEAHEGVKVRAVIPHSAADDAGILPNDVVVSIDQKQVRSSEALIRVIRDMHAGDVIHVEIRRGTDLISLRPRLGRMSDLTQEHLAYKEVVGKLSTRRSDFPRVIQHDTILQPHECGGPVMDTSGRVIGINIARADRTGSYAIPAHTIRELLAKHLPPENSVRP